MAILVAVLLLLRFRAFKSQTVTSNPWLQGIRLAIFVVGLVLAICTLAIMQFAVTGLHLSEVTARTMGIVTFSVASIFFALETNDQLRSVFSRETLESNRLLRMAGWSLLATFLVTAPNFMRKIFGTTNLNVTQWVICIAVGSLILWVTELVKIFRRHAAASSVSETVTEPAPQEPAPQIAA